MFRNSTLMRRTVFLVLAALFASTVFATFAFVLAGKNTAFSFEVEKAFQQSEELAQNINASSNRNVLRDSNYLFSNETLMGSNFFVINRNGDILYPTEFDSTDFAYSAELSYIKNNMLEVAEANNKNYAILSFSNNKQSLIIQNYINTYEAPNAFLISITTVSETNDVIFSYVNILLLSTLTAALAMLLPVVLVVNKIVFPIQEVNNVAREYGKGNYDVRANENSSGEVGELAKSFNLMAEKLSQSINDLTNERNRLEDTFNVISEGIVVFNSNGSPSVQNETMNTIFSRVPKKNLFTERLHIIPFEEVWQNVDECLATGERKELSLDGPDYAYAINIIPKFDVNNPDKCIGATGFFRDITEESKLEKTRRDYVANISHELRTPLQTLRGLIEPLADGMVKKEEDKLRYYNIILNETLRLSRLIDDMLELSKLQSRTLAFKTFPFDLNTLLSEFETKFTPVMKEARINFKVRFNTGTLPTVSGNPDRVEQILVILLDNAKKYTPAGGSITISTEFNEIDNKVYVTVSDTGQGIHEFDINHIFDRFFKADRARGKKGTGLGLAIAKELLNYMGEEITVESEYGKGTSFTFTLKRSEAANWF